MSSIASERPRQKPPEAVTDRAVAFARRRFEAWPICDSDRASSLTDETGSLESTRDTADRRALNAQHLGQHFVGEGDIIPIGAVPRGQDGAAASGFDAVNGIAGNGLQRLGQECLGEAEHGMPQFWPLRHALIQPFQENARRRSRDLGDVAAERLAGDERADKSEGALPAEDGHFDGSATPKDRHQRDDSVMEEVSVSDRLSRFKENLAPRQIHDFEVRLKPRKIFWLQSGKEPVPSVNGSL